MTLVTAQALYNLTRCPHRVYLDANGDVREKGAINSFIQLLWDLGVQTERDYLALRFSGEIADFQALSTDEAVAETARAMRQGVPVIYQGALRYERFLGRPDLLLRCEDLPSVFGEYGYDVLEIKAGRGWERTDSKTPKFKTHYAYQVLFYRMLLRHVQQAVSPVGRIVNGEHRIEEFDPEPFAEDFAQALEEACRLVDGVSTSEPVLSSQCYLCGWFTPCERWVRERSDPSSLFFVGKQKFSMREVGLRTVEDIAAMCVEDYLKPPKKIPRMGRTSLARMKERAQVLLDGAPRIRPGYGFPRTALDIYFDIEDDPTQDLTYLFGLYIREGTRAPRFDYFLARHPDDEERTVRAFWDFVASTDGATYYVYSHKERTSLKRLMERYGLDPMVFERYVEAEYDLYGDLIVTYSDWPTFSYSIKHIAKMVGFRWRDADPSGANSIAWFNEYLQNPKNEAWLDRILQYNEDDCKAMYAIKEYFQRHAQAHVA